MVSRTKRLNEQRALELLQLRYGTQIQTTTKHDNYYLINNGVPIWTCEFGLTNKFTRDQILKYEDEIYVQFGA